MTHFESHHILCPTFMITHVCICTENYIIIPLNKDGNIAVWKVNCPSETPAVLQGHHKLVTTLALSHPPSAHYLCSCSTDNIILWNLLDDEGNPKKGRVLHSHMEQPLHCCFAPDNQNIAISLTNGMWIYNLKENSWLASIEDIRFIIFRFTFQGLIGIEENYLKVWNSITNEIITKLSISSGFPSALDVSKQNNIVVVGTTCGHVNIYQKNDRLIRNIPIWKIVAQNQKFNNNDEDIYKDIKSDSFPVHSVFFFNFESKIKPSNNLPGNVYLLVITSTCLFIININNEEVLFYLDFNSDLLDVSNTSKLGLIRSAAIAKDSSNFFLFVSLIPVMGESIVLLKLMLEKIIISEEIGNTLYNKIDSNFCHLTFLSKSNCDDEKSLLTHSMQSFKKIKNLKKSPSVINLPVTFHSNVKSSGYGALHKPVKLFQPQIPKSRRSQSLSLLNSRKFESVSESKVCSYSQDKEINYTNLKLLDKLKLFETPTISHFHATVDGMYGCCPDSEGHVDVFKIMKRTIKVFHTLSCDNGEINTAKWSHTGRLMVTSGDDRTTKLWDLEKLKQNPILTIGDKGKSQVTKHRFHFEESVSHAQFYYLDRFILATSENKLHLFDYIIDTEKSGIKGIINKSTSKLLKTISLDSKQITTMVAVNQYFSILCAGTSKSINAVDMTVGKIVWHSDNIGCKAPHIIALNEGSPYVTQATQMYDLFLTSSLIDGIKLWDLRTQKAILSYKDHKCRSFPCSAAFSPCGKYIISGSEDKSVYIYDLRQLSYADKITEQTADVFTGTSFTPNSQLILSSLNGNIYLYGKDQ